MKRRLFVLLILAWFAPALASLRPAHAKSYIAYISDSSNSSVVYWIAKEMASSKNTGSIWIPSSSTVACAGFKA
jgi:hypothetical protein